MADKMPHISCETQTFTSFPQLGFKSNCSSKGNQITLPPPLLLSPQNTDLSKYLFNFIRPHCSEITKILCCYLIQHATRFNKMKKHHTSEVFSLVSRSVYIILSILTQTLPLGKKFCGQTLKYR